MALHPVSLHPDPPTLEEADWYVVADETTTTAPVPSIPRIDNPDPGTEDGRRSTPPPHELELPGTRTCATRKRALGQEDEVPEDTDLARRRATKPPQRSNAALTKPACSRKPLVCANA